MEKLIRKDYSLGEVVTVYPAVVKKFNDMELDYCCGGNKSLELALKEKGVDVDKFVEDLNKEFKEFKFENSQYVDWRGKSSEELISHIVETHHGETFRLLKEIDPLMVKVFRVHFSHDPELLMKVHSLFGKLKCELEEHLLKEENIWVSYERKMCCGIGKCGHCKIDDVYICLDGPVFNYVKGKTLVD